MIDDEQLENMLLWEAVEGGELYMTVWELNTLQPNMSESEHIDQIRPGLRRLIDRGLIRLHWERGWDELAPLTSTEIETELADPERWQPVVHGELIIALSVTAEGERVLRGRVNK